jgi:hypothetical protein
MMNFKQLGREQLSQVDAPRTTGSMTTMRTEYGSDIVEIEGFVAEGGTGFKHADGYNVHLFNFAAWRRPGQPLIERELTILRPTDAEEYFQEIPQLSLQRFQVLLSIDKSRAIVAGPATEPVNHSGLQEFAEERAKPVVLDTKLFGKLVLDRSIDYFAGQTTWNGKEVKVSFECESGYDISRAVGVAEAIWQDQPGWQQRVENCAVEQMLETKNDHWLEEEEVDYEDDNYEYPEPLSPEQFKARMKLETIQVDSRGRFEFWFDDDYMFYGHSILVQGNLDGPTYASMVG